MRIRYLSGVLLALLIVLITGCGGGDSTSETPGSDLQGQFIDSAVTNIAFVASPSGLAGTTDTSGTYSYRAGDTVEFFVGDISIGSAPAAPIITPISIVSSTTSTTVDSSNIIVLNIVRFLLSIDEDADPSNGIQIPDAIIAAATGVSLDFSSVTFDADAATVLADLASAAGIAAITGALVDATPAMNHLNDSIATCEFTGLYSGTWQQTSPDMSDNGFWSFSVSTTGTLSGSGGSNVFAGDDFEMSGTISANGDTEVTAGSTTTGASFSGTVDAAGIVSGTWSNATFGTSGTFTGSRSADSSISCGGTSTPPDGGNGGNGGNGSTDLGSLTATGTDVTSGGVASTFTPVWEAAVYFNVNDNAHVTWTDFDTANPPVNIGDLTHQMELQFDSVTGVIGSLQFRATHIGVGSYFYRLDCAVGSCSGLGVTANDMTKEVTFTDAVLVSTNGPGNSATASITVSGTITYN